MKRKITGAAALAAILTMSMLFTACGNQEEHSSAAEVSSVAEEDSGAEAQGSKEEKPESEAQEKESAAETPTPVPTLPATVTPTPTPGQEENADETLKLVKTESSYAEILGEEAQEFIYTSGAGAWSTDMTVYPDGSFTGTFHDADMGDERAENGVIYFSRFSGRFGALRRIDSFTFQGKVEALWMEEPEDTTWEEDGTLYISTLPYGISKDASCTFYLPGRQTTDLPEEFVNWVCMPRAWSAEELPEVLPFYGIYNRTDDAGFSSAEVEFVTTEIVESPLPAGYEEAFLTYEGCLFPDSSVRRLGSEDIENLTRDQIQLAINELYARNGYDFGTESLRQHFDSFAWYAPDTDSMDVAASRMSDIEYDNLMYLGSYLNN